MPNYRYVYRTPDTTEDGRPLIFGDVVELDSQQLDVPHHKLLLDDGRLVELLPEPRGLQEPSDEQEGSDQEQDNLSIGESK